MKWVMLGDEISALGWRLAGARALIADEHTLAAQLADARRTADLLFITADLASDLPAAELDALLMADKPLVTVVAAARGGREPRDLEQDVKHLLGLAV